MAGAGVTGLGAAAELDGATELGGSTGLGAAAEPDGATEVGSAEVGGVAGAVASGAATGEAVAVLGFSALTAALVPSESRTGARSFGFGFASARGFAAIDVAAGFTAIAEATAGGESVALSSGRGEASSSVAAPCGADACETVASARAALPGDVTERETQNVNNEAASAEPSAAHSISRFVAFFSARSSLAKTTLRSPQGFVGGRNGAACAVSAVVGESVFVGTTRNTRGGKRDATGGTGVSRGRDGGAKGAGGAGGGRGCALPRHSARTESAKVRLGAGRL